MYKKITLLIVVIIVLSMSVLTVFSNRTISYLERRYLDTFPKVDLADPDFYEDLDDYLSDHLFFRDELITVRNLTNRYLFHFKDNDGVYSKDGYLFDILKFDAESVSDLILKTNELKDSYFSDREVYFIGIPRKNDYSELYHPSDLRFDDIRQLLIDGLDMPLIDISGLLSLDSYYHTDIHWRQDKLKDVARYIVEAIGDIYVPVTTEAREVYSFYGSLFSRSFYDVNPDILYYLEGDFTGVRVYDLEKDSEVPVYDKEATTHPDLYDIYLDGPSAYLRIENEDAKIDQRLIVFRDSFASSLLPLLIDSYSRIDVIDLRYFDASLIESLDLDDKAKVLFIYGSEFIDQSGALR